MKTSSALGRRITGWLALAALAIFNLQPSTALAQGTTPAPKASTAATAASLAIPSGLALVPAGSFTMGDTLDGEADAIPTNVSVSAFYMDTNLVS
jgi:formylglycine-generating enzyme required for sulfatase activity